jgi:hypothetical protein
MTETNDRFENKASAGAPAGDINAMFGDFMGAFEAFKETNDQRIAQIERRGSSDAVTEDKLNRLNSALDAAKAAIDRQSLERARPRLEGGAIAGGDEYKDAFAAYVKRGEEKALSIGSNPDGGYVVPPETDTEITRLMTVLHLYDKSDETPFTVRGFTVRGKRRTRLSGRNFLSTKDVTIEDVGSVPSEVTKHVRLLESEPAVATLIDDRAIDAVVWVALFADEGSISIDGLGLDMTLFGERMGLVVDNFTEFDKEGIPRKLIIGPSARNPSR